MATAISPHTHDHSQHRHHWRFTWETLAHLPVLRLYLFHPDLSTSSFSHLRADLRLDDSLLLVSFSHGGGYAVVLRVPVPRVLVDPASPVECRAAGDHVEVRLALVLPVDHPVVAAALPPAVGAEAPAPLALRDDLKSLSSGDAHLYCKTCSARLTKQPLRHIAEMPSLNWQDVADNWFGGCCCTFGGASEKLISQYINSYDRLEGTSLLDATSISVETDFLEVYAFQERDLGCGRGDSMPSNGFIALHEAISGINARKVHTAKKVELNYSEKQSTYHKNSIDSTHMLSPVLSAEVSCASSIEENKETGRLAQPSLVQLENDIDVDSLKSNVDCCVENTEKPFNESEDNLSVDPCHCCFDNEGDNEKTGNNLSSTSSGRQKKEHILETRRDFKLEKNISLGGSFIVKASNLSNDVEWVELLCSHCSSPLGSYPSQCSHAPADGRIRLFKCYISTDLPVGGPHDVFRRHTLQRIFVNLLLDIAEDEISFRTVVRDLKTKRPMLQIVLLSSKVWMFSGCCYENDVDGSHGAADLRPAVKFLFSDCSNVSEAELRPVEEWSTKYRAEEVYMMRRQIDELIKCLNSAMDKLPLSNSSLQGMYLSSLER